MIRLLYIRTRDTAATDALVIEVFASATATVVVQHAAVVAPSRVAARATDSLAATARVRPPGDGNLLNEWERNCSPFLLLLRSSDIHVCVSTCSCVARTSGKGLIAAHARVVYTRYIRRMRERERNQRARSCSPFLIRAAERGEGGLRDK